MQGNSNNRSMITGTVSLILAIIFFSGFTKNYFGGIFDFSKVSGAFPPWFGGHGAGVGAKQGFIFAITLVPSVMLALGALAVFEHFGALLAASKFLSLILKPIMGIPGISAISLIAGLQSTDAGSSTTKFLKDEGKMADKELLIFAAFQFSAGATITNFLSSMEPLLSNLVSETGKTVPTSVATCFVVIFAFKFVGANIMRLYVKFFVK